MSIIKLSSLTNHIPIRFLLLSSFLALLLSPTLSLADNLRSPGYEIRMSTINVTGGRKESGGYTLTDTVGQTVQGQFDSTGYTIKAGFQYIHTLVPFTFTISDLDIDLGYLIPNAASTASHNLSVRVGSAFGYGVSAIADHPLQNTAAAQIPDTSCNPATPCTLNDANIWTSTTSYGFGYNMAGDDVNITDFVDSTYFRPFPSASFGHSPVTVMSRTGSANDTSTATVTYKVLVDATQESGQYTNIIQYIATPSF